MRGGKGDKDQVTIIPQTLIPALTEQVLLAKKVYDQDRLANRHPCRLTGQWAGREEPVGWHGRLTMKCS